MRSPNMLAAPPVTRVGGIDPGSWAALVKPNHLTPGCERARRPARHMVEAAVTHPPGGSVGPRRRRPRAAHARYAGVAVVAGAGWVPVFHAAGGHGGSRDLWDAAVAAWSRTGEHFPVGSRWPLAGAFAISLSPTGRPARVDTIASVCGPLAVDAREHGIRSAVAVPIVVEGRVWGVMLAGSSLKRARPAGTEACLASFADLLAAAISNADSRAGITRLADKQAALRRVAPRAGRQPPA